VVGLLLSLARLLSLLRVPLSLVQLRSLLRLLLSRRGCC
jgi:hypothetical protein